jgi:hypothetical protein
MAKSISVKRKKAGRPATGTEPLYGVRIGDALMKQIMDWAKPQGATRSDAIRRLVELGLTVKTRPKQPAPALAERAKALASKVIDSFATDAVDVEETASRKRRLLKGPEEFRETRVDRPKAKTK